MWLNTLRNNVFKVGHIAHYCEDGRDDNEGFFHAISISQAPKGAQLVLLQLVPPVPAPHRYALISSSSLSTEFPATYPVVQQS